MTRIALPMALLIALLWTVPAAIADRSSAIYMEAGVNNESGHSLDGLVDVALNDSFGVNAGYGRDQTDESDGELVTRQSSIGIAGTLADIDGIGLNWSLAYAVWGKSGEIETRDTIVGAGLRYADFSLDLDIENGNIELFTDPALPLSVRSVNSGRSAWRLTAGLLFGSSLLRASVLERDYDRNLAALNQSQRIRRRFSQIAVQQAYALSSDEVTLEYEYFLDTMDLGVNYSRVDSVLDDRVDEYAGLLLRYYLDAAATAELRLDRELQDGFTTLSFGMGYYW